MAKLTENQKLAVVCGVAVLLTGLGGAGVYWAKGLVKEKEDSIAAMRTEIAAAQAKIAKIPELEDKVIILRENLNEYVKMLPESAGLNEFTRIAQQFVSQSQVEMPKFLPGKNGRAKSTAFERYEYRAEVNGSLWQLMHFMSLFENYERFVQIKDFSLAAATGKDSHIEPVHSVQMTIETYVYKAGDKGKDVMIANYDAKVEKLREEIFEARQTITKEGYKFDGDRGRRDIFIDPRQRVGVSMGDENGPSPRDQRRIIDRLREQVTEAETLVRRLDDTSLTIFERYALERSLREMLVTLEQQISETNSQGLISHAPLKLAWNREVIEPVAKIRGAVSSTAQSQRDQWLPEEEMKALYARMREDLIAGDIQAALDRYGMVEEQIRVPDIDARYAIFTRIEGLYIRAKLADEFSSLEVQVSGVMVNEVGKSGVILNGTVYEEGEYVDSNLLVKAVERDRIEFVYKGFTVVKTL